MRFRSLDAMGKNLSTIGAAARAYMRAGSVRALGPARRTYDLLMLDAPYATGAGSVALDKLNRLGWVGPDSWISIETAEKETVDVAGFEIDATRKVGTAKLTLLVPADPLLPQKAGCFAISFPARAPSSPP